MGQPLAFKTHAHRFVGQPMPIRVADANLDAQIAVERLLRRVNLLATVPIAVRADAPNLHSPRIVLVEHQPQLLARGERIVADRFAVLFSVSTRQFRYVFRQPVTVAVKRLQSNATSRKTLPARKIVMSVSSSRTSGFASLV